MITEIRFSELYEDAQLSMLAQKTRYGNLSIKFSEAFGHTPKFFFSAPGRTEISGNHTDHNRGKVIAASINLDSVACASQCDETIKVYSEGYDEPFVVILNDLEPAKKEAGTTTALIRGIAAGFVKHGYKIGGFEAFISSNVMPGSGLSSSASIEVLLGTILNHFYNEASVPPEIIALIGQFSENNYFMKPCGLMDQTACAVGGIISIDFKNRENPVIRKVNFDFMQQNYTLVVVHTGGSHFNLTDDYASVPEEMRSVASQFGREVCREVPFETFFSNLKNIRKDVSDRAILRAYHFYKENERVSLQVEALNNNDFNGFLKLVSESGNSSFRWLQNIYSPQDVSHQNITLALAMTEEFISRTGEGACRIHGGGFEGTIQIFLPNERVDEYQKFIIDLFEDFKVYRLTIRQTGAVKVTDL